MESLYPLVCFHLICEPLLSRARPVVSVIFFNMFYCFGQIFSFVALFSFNFIFVCTPNCNNVVIEKSIILYESVCFLQYRADKNHEQWYPVGFTGLVSPLRMLGEHPQSS